MILVRDTFELIRRAALGLASFVLLITALTIKGQAQQTGPSIKERANTASANTLWYNSTLGVNMLAGRFLMIIPTLAIAGSLVRKKIVPPSLGTFPVTTPLFTALLVSVIVILGALTFFPVLSLGPIVEHLLMYAGKTF